MMFKIDASNDVTKVLKENEIRILSVKDSLVEIWQNGVMKAELVYISSSDTLPDTIVFLTDYEAETVSGNAEEGIELIWEDNFIISACRTLCGLHFKIRLKKD